MSNYIKNFYLIFSKGNKNSLLSVPVILFSLLFYVSCSDSPIPNNIPDESSSIEYLQVTYDTTVLFKGQGAFVNPIISDQSEIEISKYEISVLDKNGQDRAIPEGITIDSNTGTILIDSATKVTSPYGLDLVVTITYTSKNNIEEKAKVNFRLFVLTDGISFKEDMHVNARKVLSIGDVDNEYLYRVNDFTNAVGVSGDIIIVNTNTGEEVYKGVGLEAVDSEIELDANGGKINFVGIGPSKDNPINMDELPDYFEITLIVYTNNQEVNRLPDLLVKKGTEGTMEGYKAIYSWRDLTKIDNDLNGNYEMMNDIIFPDRNTFGFINFKPISLIDNNPGAPPFTGVFDGQNYIISKIYIDYKDKNGVGLFAKATDVTIRDLTIEHNGVHGRDQVGALVGHITGDTAQGTSLITNVHIETLGVGGVVQGNDRVGGLIGAATANYSNNSDHLILDVSTQTPVLGRNNVGGIVGSTSFSILTGYSAGSVNAAYSVGGIAGTSTRYPISTISQTDGETTTIVGYSTGNIYGNNDAVGGLIGTAFERYTFVYGYSTGDVKGKSDVGGLIGQLTMNNGAYLSISNINVRGYSTGTIIGTDRVGGVVGSTFSKATDIVGYSRAKISSFMNSIAFFIGVVNNFDETGVEKKYKGYYSKDESEFLLEGDIGLDGENVDGSSIDIREVTDANKETYFEGFTFGTAMGEWTWVGDGKWPAINIAIQKENEQPVSGSYGSKNVDIDFPSDLSGIQLMSEKGDTFTFRIAELLDADIYRNTMLTGAWQFDMYPTGLFVPPGGSIEVTVLNQNEGNDEPRLMMGTYLRHASERYTGTRQQVFNLSDKMTIKNDSSFPRILYLDFSVPSFPNQIVDVEIKGARKLPYLILNKTTTQEFKEQMVNLDGNGYDSIMMASDSFIYIMSKENAEKYDYQDWNSLAKVIDKMIEICRRDINGLDGSSDLHKVPPVRILITETTGGGYMFSTPVSGIFVQSKSAWQWIKLNFIDNSWGFWHEIGHQLQPSSFWNGGTQEVYVNVYSLHIQRFFGKESSLKSIWEDSKLPNYLNFKGDKDYFNHLNNHERLVLYEQLRLEFGNDFFAKVHKYIRENWREYPDSTPAEVKNENFVKVTSIVSGRNLSDFFKTWGYNPNYSIYTNKIITQLPPPSNTLINRGFR